MHKIELLFLNSEDLYIILKELLVQNVSRIKFIFLESEEKMKKKNACLKDFKKEVLDTF